MFLSYHGNNELIRCACLYLLGSRHLFNVSWLVGGHPVLDHAVYIAEAKRIVGSLFDLLQSAPSLPGCLTITVVNW